MARSSSPVSVAMWRRAVFCLLFAAFLSAAGCKTSQGNGEAKPENTSNQHNPDNQKNNVRQGETAGSGGGTATKPAPSQTPGQPASKTDTSR